MESFAEFSRRLCRLTAGDPRNWIVSEQVDSTSSQGRRFLERYRRAGISPVPSCCFVAWEQSAGRGRGRRSWSSPPGLGLAMTFVVPGLSGATTAQLPFAVAVLVARVVSEQVEAPVRIKWPNDVLCSGKKIAGILIEARSRGDAETEALVGIGLNVHHAQGELPVPEATSLLLEGAAAADTAQLASTLAEGLSIFLAEPISMAELVDEYREWSRHRVGDTMRCRIDGDGEVEGRFAGFGEDGALLLDCDDGVRSLACSEIVEHE